MRGYFRRLDLPESVYGSVLCGVAVRFVTCDGSAKTEVELGSRGGFAFPCQASRAVSFTGHSHQYKSGLHKIIADTFFHSEQRRTCR